MKQYIFINSKSIHKYCFENYFNTNFNFPYTSLNNAASDSIYKQNVVSIKNLNFAI